MNKKILNLAIPSIVSNITVPLLGLVDVAIVGHLGCLYWCDCRGRNALQYDILDVCFPANGNKRVDIASLW